MAPSQDESTPAPRARGAAGARLAEQAARHAPDPLLLATEGQVQWVSESVEAALGWSPAELTDRRLVDLCHPDDQGALTSLISEAGVGGAHRGVIRMMAKDGRHLRVLVTLAHGDGKDSGVLAGTVREIDQRAQRDQDAADLLAWQREITRQSGEALLRVDDTGHVARADPSITSLLGWTPQEIIGRGPAELAHPDDEPRLTAAWSPAAATRSASATGPAASVAFRGACKDGSWKWLEERGLPIRSAPDTESIRMLRLRDITAEMATREAIEEERSHHRSIIDAILDPFVVLEAVRDSDGRIVDFTFAEANSAACEFNQTTPDQLIGARLLGQHPAAGLTELFASYVRVVDDAEPFIRNAWSYPQDLLGGALRKYDVRAVKFDDGLAQTWRDVTERAEAHAQVTLSAARLRAVMDAMVDPQVLSEPIRAQDGTITDFVIEDANVQACAAIGLRLDEIIGRTLRTVLPDLTQAELMARYVTVADSGEPMVLDDFPQVSERLPLERILDIRCTQVQGGQINLTWRDVTERRRDRRLLAESEARMRAVMDAAPVGMARIGLDDRFEEVNPALCRMLLHEAEWLKHHGMVDILHPEDASNNHRMREAVAQGTQQSATWEERLVRSDGHTLWALHSLAAIRDRDGAITSFVSQFEDVTEAHLSRERVSASERLYRLLAENASDVVVHLREGTISWISPSVANVLGGEKQDWIGERLRNYIHPFDLRAYDESLDRASAGEATMRRTRICTHDGQYHWIEAHFAPFRDESGIVDGVSASMRNVDVEVQALAELDRQTRIDALTGLMTRREAMRRIEEESVGLRREPGGVLAVLFCDVDRFKDINDAFGHAIGDAVLRTLATRITEAVRLDDVVARMGGDELIVMITGAHDLGEATEVAEKLRRVARAPMRISDAEVRTSLSIGVILAEPGEPVDALIARADAAMYQAKEAGRDRVVALPA